MNKAEYVFLLALNVRTKSVLLFESKHRKFWTLPSGPVSPDEEEQDAIGRFLFNENQWQPGFGIMLDEQLGPLHILPNGMTAKAFYCSVNQSGRAVGIFSSCAFHNKESLKTLRVESDPIARMILDGLSILERPMVLPCQTEDGVTGIYCDPGKLHLLVEETSSRRHEWPRLMLDGSFMKS